MTENQLIAEIKSNLRTYDEQGMLDTISIRGWIKECIKEFGGNIMYEYQVPLRVNKGTAKLPNNYWAMRNALKCEGKGYKKQKDNSKHVQARIYTERYETDNYLNFISRNYCEDDCDKKYVVDTIYFETEGTTYDTYFGDFTRLKLVKHMYKTRCGDCVDFDPRSPYEISIDENHNYLHTNFNEGFIWLHYKGLPCDEKGGLMIPDTSRDKLKNYIIYTAIYKSLELLVLRDVGENVFNKLQYFKAEADKYFAEAGYEARNKGSVGWATKLVNKNRSYMNMMDRLIPNLRHG